MPGAEEYSAMASAEGAIQEKSYNSTFPLLINLNDRPTYLVSLKDDAGLVKAYAFVDVQDYQKVKVTSSDEGLKAAANNYLKMLGVSNINVDGSDEISGTVEMIENVVIDGNTYYYIKLENDDTIFKAIISTDDGLPFVKAGDNLEFYASDDLVTGIKNRIE